MLCTAGFFMYLCDQLSFILSLITGMVKFFRVVFYYSKFSNSLSVPGEIIM